MRILDLIYNYPYQATQIRPKWQLYEANSSSERQMLIFWSLTVAELDIHYKAMASCDGTICDLLQFVTAARFVTKSASICDWPYMMILDCKLWREKLVFVFTLTMYIERYNMMHIYIYELWHNICTNGGARGLLLFYINTFRIPCMTYTHNISYISIIFYVI